MDQDTNRADNDSFLMSLLKGMASGLLQLVLAFVVGTIAAGIACLYYDVPLVFSLAGGFIVLGIALALSTDSIFD